MNALDHIRFMFRLDFFRDCFGNPIQIQKKPERNPKEIGEKELKTLAGRQIYMSFMSLRNKFYVAYVYTP
jgi:hypothetical protein